MRIRTQLFIGITTLLLTLVGVQWWLQSQQLRALEDELTDVATRVGERVYLKRFGFTADELTVKTKPDGSATTISAGSEKDHRKIVTEFVASTGDEGDQAASVTPDRPAESAVGPDVSLPAPKNKSGIWVTAGNAPESVSTVKTGSTHSKIEVRAVVEGEKRFLVIHEINGRAEQIPIPIDKSRQIVDSTRRQGLFAGLFLLLAGVIGAVVVSHRVTQPLRQLTRGVESLGRGEFGAQVAVNTGGEIGELQATFNRISQRLDRLEAEKEEWQKREHLAELGALARGLAHTLRNPLNTLGLVVEELASATGDGGEPLVRSARGQIRRIDRWLRSFLAIGAEGAAHPQPVKPDQILQDLAFECIQSGHPVTISTPPVPITLTGIEPALRSALANLVENAVEASPAGEPVRIEVTQTPDRIVIRIMDKGPGMPAAARQRLFSPHNTTKPGGSGMGMFLSHHLIEGLHQGTLTIEDVPGGGTAVIVSLPAGSIQTSDGEGVR